MRGRGATGNGGAWRIASTAAVRDLRRPVIAYAVSRLAVLFAHLVVTAVRSPAALRDAWMVWDGGWYLTIVQTGYSSDVPTGQSNVAFFPLYPLLARAVAALPAVGPVDALLAVSLVSGLTATCLLWLLAADLYDRDAADRAATLFAFAPGAFVFSLLYSEGVFLTAAVAACWALIRRRYVAGGLLSALATSARPNGLALVAVAAAAAGVAIAQRRDWRALIAPVLAPAGFLAYMAFTWVNTGRADSWFLAQRLGWFERTDLGARLDDARSVAGTVFGADPANWNAIVPTIGLVVAVVSFVLLVRSRTPIELIVFTVVVAALALSSATLGMRPRFLLSAFPLTIALACWVRSTQAYSLVLAASAAALVSLAVVTSATIVLTP